MTDSLSLQWAMDDAFELETVRQVDGPRILSRRPRRRCLSAIRSEELASFYTKLPEPGESLHIVSNGRFDYWHFAPVSLALLKRPAEALYGSTWTMNRANVAELLDLYDSGKVKSLAITTGTYFKRRESAVCNTLVSGLLDRGQRFRAFQNHAKVLLIGAPPDFLTIEGSANWTANPRLEQSVVSNDRDLYEFHRSWFEEMLR